MAKKINISKEFIQYSKILAEDILGYNECFGGDSDVKRKLKYHSKRCDKILNQFEN